MTINEYQEKALRTASGYRSDSLLLNGVMGLCGESGECIDIVKKAMFQGHTLDREHLAEELGVTAEGLGYDLESIMQRNIDKLAKRYPDGFETERSTHREE